RHFRAAPVVLFWGGDELLRRDRQAPRREAPLGGADSRAISAERCTLVYVAYTLSDVWGEPHGAAALEQRGADDGGGARGRVGRNPEPAHQRLGRGGRTPLRCCGPRGALHAAHPPARDRR